MAVVHVGLGSNLGDRREFLGRAMESIAGLGLLIAGSPIYETAPVGGPDQGPYLNAVVAFDTELGPSELLDSLREIERVAGRDRVERWGPRSIDLDILWYDGRTIDEAGLTVPHREIRNRRFVLAPLIDIAPGLKDAVGPYAEALGPVTDQSIRRMTGPYDVEDGRWMVGIEEATNVQGDGDGFIVVGHKDWANLTGDMFGAFMSAVALRAVGRVAGVHQPSSISYRFVHGIKQGESIEASVEKIRSTSRSADHVVSLMVDGRLMGTASVSTVAETRALIVAPESPAVLPLSECAPVSELNATIDRLMGPTARSWCPLERWDIPDLADGTTDSFRAWSPNLTVGSDDLFLRAAAIMMPIDAMLWRSVMLRLDLLQTTEVVATPTLEFSARFPNLAVDSGWHLGEVVIDHMTDRSVSGTIRVWAEDGSYLSIGTSHNVFFKLPNVASSRRS